MNVPTIVMCLLIWSAVCYACGRIRGRELGKNEMADIYYGKTD